MNTVLLLCVISIFLCLLFFLSLPAIRRDRYMRHTLLSLKNGTFSDAAPNSHMTFQTQLDELLYLYKKHYMISYRKDELNSSSQLMALQSQINPHFLYNTLESIRAQAELDDALQISEMTEALAAYFRYNINRGGDVVPLEDELANISNYLHIQQFRFGERFSISFMIDGDRNTINNQAIPKLTIQPIVENAIYHGLEETLTSGKIIIRVTETEKRILLSISDNGKGIDYEQLEMIHRDLQTDTSASGSERTTGIALSNIHRRIQLLFGDSFGIALESTPMVGTTVHITMPKQAYQEENK